MNDAFQKTRPILRRLVSDLGRVMQGQKTAIRHLLAAFAAGGHVLPEDVPGTGKTTLAKALARSCRAEFQRVQFTPDLLPADILGVSVLNPASRTFGSSPGPIFRHILLADEINRASPRTQSALLSAFRLTYRKLHYLACQQMRHAAGRSCDPLDVLAGKLLAVGIDLEEIG